MTDEKPAAPPPPPPAVAPGMAELFEQSLLALARAPSVFAAASLRPAPSFVAAAGLALASGAAALAVGLGSNLVFLQRFPPPMIATMAAAALGIYASLLLLFAVLLYGLGRSLGGSADFDRALQGAAAVSLVTPLQAVGGGFPIVWALPPMLAAWVAAGALEGLFKTRPFPARAACALLALVAIGLQFAGRVFVERAGRAYALTQAAASTVKSNDDLLRRIQAVQSQAVSMPGPASAGTSGLDLLRGPEDAAPPGPAAVEDSPAALMKDAAEVRQNASQMLGSIAPMLDSAAASKKLTPQQKSDMKDLQALMKDLQAQMQPGAPRLSAAEQAQRMARIQQMTLRMLSTGMQSSQAPQSEVKK